MVKLVLSVTAIITAGSKKKGLRPCEGRERYIGWVEKVMVVPGGGGGGGMAVSKLLWR